MDPLTSRCPAPRPPILDPIDDDSPHYRHSVLRECIVEHVFVGEVLRHLWQRNVTDVEVLRSELDAGGYDVVMTRGTTIRHIQLKTLTVGGKAAGVSIGLKLAARPSGCVIWIVVTSDLEIESYLWFGGKPGTALPGIDAFPAARHTKGNAQGLKADKPNHRFVPKRAFVPLATIGEVVDALFGPQS